MYKFYIDALCFKPHVSLGAQALINATIQIIENRYPDSEYYLLSACPEVERDYLRLTGCDCHFIQRPRGSLRTFAQARRLASRVDAVISPWGDAYVSSPPHLALPKTLTLKRPGVPLMLMTSSLGPFEKGWRRRLAKMALKRFDVLTVRDTVTYDLLRSLGFHQTKLLPDTAFVLKPAAPERVQEIFAQEGIPSLQPGRYVGINVSILLYNRMKQRGADYAAIICALIQRVRTLTHLPVVLIPHQYYSTKMLEHFPQYKDRLRGEGGDDRQVFPMIYEQLADSSQVHAVNGEYSCNEYKGIISGCEIFIGGRMHTIIASLSCAVPSIIMEYSHKAAGLMNMLSLSKYCWSIQHSTESLWQMLSLLWNTKDSYRQKLTQSMPEIQKQAYSSIEEIDRYLKKTE